MTDTQQAADVARLLPMKQLQNAGARVLEVDGVMYVELQPACQAIKAAEERGRLRELAALAIIVENIPDMFHDGLAGDLLDVPDKAHAYQLGVQERSMEIAAMIRARSAPECNSHRVPQGGTEP